MWMADPHVISALRSKRAELSGELIAAEARIVQLRADINSLDGAIRVFDPTAAQTRDLARNLSLPASIVYDALHVMASWMMRDQTPSSPLPRGGSKTSSTALRSAPGPA